jgi:hypothetical protein
MDKLSTLRCFADHLASELEAGLYRKTRPGRMQRAWWLLEKSASLVAQAGDVLEGR